MEKCTKCKLSTQCKRIVPSTFPEEGEERLPLFFVGEAPGRLEDIKGKPFIGDAGKIFDRALKVADIDRKKCAVGNVLRCRPPENRDPRAEEMKACAEFLDAEIKEYNPKIIVALGRFALNRLTKRTGIKKLQGNVIESPYGKVIPCLHPAAVIRNPDDFHDIVQTLGRVKDVLEGRERKAEIKILIADTVKKVKKVVDEAITKKCLVIDLETTGFSFINKEVLCYALTWSPKMGIIIPLIQQHKEAFWSDKELKEVKKQLKRLGASDVPKIGHNIKFDMKFCKAAGIPLKNVKFDTLLAHYLLDENREHGLKPLALQYTDFGEYDKGIKKHVTEKEDDYSKIPNEELWEYAAKDVAATHILFKEFGPKIKKNFNSFYKKWIIPMVHLLTEVEYKGIAVDPVEAEYMVHTYVNRIGKKETELQKIPAVVQCVDDFYKRDLEKLRKHFLGSSTLCKRYKNDFEAYRKWRKIERPEFNFGSPKQLQYLFYNVLKLKVIKKTKTGAPSTDAEVVEHYAKKIPEIAPIVQQRTYKKWLSTYILPTVGNTDFRVHTTFLIHGTVTGRLASRQPNLQNIPRDAKDLKRIYIPDNDCIFVAFDYAQAEFRLWGNYARDEKMLEDLRSGLDIHKLVASECFGVPYDDVDKRQRQKAKNSTFGIMYGRGAKSVAEEHGFSVDEAKLVIKRFFKRYPKAKRWVDNQQMHVRKYGEVQNVFGRIRRLPEIFGDDREKKAEALRLCINAPIQSAASDFTCFAGLRVQDKIIKDIPEVYLVMLIHDSLMYNIPKSKALSLVPAIKKELTKELPEIVVPMDVDIKVGHNYGDMEEIPEEELVRYVA